MRQFLLKFLVKTLAVIVVSLSLTLQSTGPASAFAWPWQRPQAEENLPPRPVVSEILGNRPRTERSVPGVIAARVEVVLGFQTLGRLVERHVEIGKVVQKGDLLAALDPSDLRDNVSAATAARDAAQVRLRTAQAAADRTRALAKRNVASAALLEQAEQELTAADSAAQQAESALARARDAEGFAKMEAPFAGVISDIYEETGAIIPAGAPVLKLSEDSNLEAVIDLPEAALAGLKIGDPFELWAESTSAEALPAEVRLIEPMADAATRTRRVRLTLKAPGGLRIGSLIRARPVAAGGEILTLPASAVLDRPEGPEVWRVSRKGEAATVSRQKVELSGPVISGRVAVTSGLEAGDEIVIRGIHVLSEGQAVGRSVAP